MFIFAGNTKEKIATTGTVLACLIFELFAISMLMASMSNIIISLLFFLIPVVIYKGIKFGYQLARFIFGFMAISTLTMPINPFSITDFPNGISWPGISAFLSVSLISMFAFYSLGEHARLRNIYPTEKKEGETGETKFPWHWVVIGVPLILLWIYVATLPSLLFLLMNEVKQNKDLGNIQQCGEAFYRYAKDHNGNFPSTNTTSTDLFNELIKEGYITDERIVAGSGAREQMDGEILSSSNVAWSCATGLTTNDNPGYALLWSRGTVPCVTNGSLLLDAWRSYCGTKGKQFIAVYYLDQSASCPKFSGTNFIATIPLHGPSTNVYTNFLNP